MKIGIFDSGYGGLTILRDILRQLPAYDYIYLGDNARAPYGSRSFDVVYQYTWQAVKHLFDLDCQLVILACNTASAKALRTIQQHDLPLLHDNSRRVLGVIIPTVEKLTDMSASRHIGILGTQGTVNSHSYLMEINKIYPDMRVTEMACPMWVPLIENNEAESPATDYFVAKYCDLLLSKDNLIDTIVLACTHYPLIYHKIRDYVPDSIRIVTQGDIIAASLTDYLNRHPEIENVISKGETVDFYTTENPEKFDAIANLFISCGVHSQRISI